MDNISTDIINDSLIVLRPLYLQIVKIYTNFGDQELNTLKPASIDYNLIWKSAGKPRQGPIFDKKKLNICITYYFLPSVGMFPREFKIKKMLLKLRKLLLLLYYYYSASPILFSVFHDVCGWVSGYPLSE